MQIFIAMSRFSGSRYLVSEAPINTGLLLRLTSDVLLLSRARVMLQLGRVFGGRFYANSWLLHTSRPLMSAAMRLTWLDLSACTLHTAAMHSLSSRRTSSHRSSMLVASQWGRGSALLSNRHVSVGVPGQCTPPCPCTPPFPQYRHHDSYACKLWALLLPYTFHLPAGQAGNRPESS